MKTNYPPLKSLFFGLALVGLLSCNDHRIPNPTPGANRLRVKSITRNLPDNKADVSQFEYDGQGRLSKIIAYQTPDSSLAAVEVSTYEYDAQNRMTKLTNEIVRRSGTSPNPVETYSYAYNALGQITGVSYGNNVPGNSGSLIRMAVQYDGNNRIVGSTTALETGFFTYDAIDVFTYTGNNITTRMFGSNIARNNPRVPPVAASTATLAYDTKINPFYGLPVIPAPGNFPSFLTGTLAPNAYFGGVSNSQNLSQNNLHSVAFAGGQSTIYAYNYNADNLPTNRVVANGSVSPETLQFSYEPY